MLNHKVYIIWSVLKQRSWLSLKGNIQLVRIVQVLRVYACLLIYMYSLLFKYHSSFSQPCNRLHNEIAPSFIKDYMHETRLHIYTQIHVWRQNNFLSKISANLFGGRCYIFCVSLCGLNLNQTKNMLSLYILVIEFFSLYTALNLQHTCDIYL